MAEQKKYRRLDEVYLKETFAKLVPLLPRQQTLLSEQPGTAEILIQTDDDKIIGPTRIPSALADRVIDIINKQQKMTSKSGKEFTVNEIVLKSLQIDRWVTNEKDPLYEAINSIFSKAKINYNNFSNLEEIQTDDKNPLRTKLLATPQSIMRLSELIPPAFRELFINPSDAEKVLVAIWGITPQKKGANVGPGEIALSLISDAIKADTGDLEIEGLGKIEVKGAGARMGGDNFAIAGTLEALNNILKQRTQGVTSVSAQTLSIIKQQLIAIVEAELTVLANALTPKPNVNGRVRTLHPEHKRLVETQLGQLRNIEQKLKTADNLEEVLADVELAVDLDNKFKNGFPTASKGELRAKMKSTISKYVSVKKGEKHGSSSRSKGSKASYGPSVKDFFSIPDLSIKERVDGVAATRSYTNTPVKSIENALAVLMKEYGDKIFTVTGSEESDGAPLYKVIAAIHMAEYQLNQGFNYFILFNTVGEEDEESKSAPDKIVSYRFDSNDLSVNIINIFKFLMVFRAEINLSIDTTRHSVGVRIQ